MSKMKNTIVLRDIKSNLVEEAIIVFKENVKIKEEQKMGKTSQLSLEEGNSKNEIYLEEAQSIISDYANKLEKSKNEASIKAKMRFLQGLNIALVIASVLILLIK